MNENLTQVLGAGIITICVSLILSILIGFLLKKKGVTPLAIISFFGLFILFPAFRKSECWGLGILLGSLITLCIHMVWAYTDRIVTEERLEKEKKAKTEEQIQIAEKGKQIYLEWLHSNYKITKLIGVKYGLDWDMRQVCACDETNKVILFGKNIIEFDKILQVEMLTTTSEHTTTKTSKDDAIGRAILGKVVAGNVGAVVGAASARETSRSNTIINNKVCGVVIYLSDIANPIYKYYSPYENDNREIYAILISIIHSNSKTNENGN